MKILIVQTGFIGDVILSTPVFYNLKKIYPQAKITLLTTKEAFPLMKMQESLDTVKVFDKRQTKKGLKGIQEMAKELANENFDAVFSLHKSFRTALLLKLSKIPHRYGFKESKLNFLYTGVSARDYTHEALRNLAILKNINVNIEKISQDLQLNFDEETRVEAEKLLAEVSTEKLIGIAPGSVWATKRWTTAGFSEAAQHFSDKGFRVVLLGGPSDEQLGKEIETNCKAPLLNLIGKCNLAVSAFIISKLQLLLTNDSAPLHIASATKTPVTAIFCATVPEFGFGPWKTKFHNIGLDSLSCRPCGRHGKQHCPIGTHACQKDLKAEAVIQVAENLL